VTEGEHGRGAKKNESGSAAGKDDFKRAAKKR
jgi:hypothetical protein